MRRRALEGGEDVAELAFQKVAVARPPRRRVQHEEELNQAQLRRDARHASGGDKPDHEG